MSALPAWVDLPCMSTSRNDLMRRGWDLINLADELSGDDDTRPECWAEAVRVEKAFQEASL